MSIQSAMSTTYSSASQAASSVKNTIVNHKKEVAVLLGLTVTAGVVYAGYQNADAISESITGAYTSAMETLTESFNSAYTTLSNLFTSTPGADNIFEAAANGTLNSNGTSVSV
jgi:hypothetical protein